jgi:sec-independent protein translocase protein TatB
LKDCDAVFDIGWTELVVIACVAVLVVGPKDLPKMLRTFGKTVSQLRRMAGDFQKQFNDALQEAELDEVKNIASGKTFQPLEDARKSMTSFQKSVSDSVRDIESDVKSGMDISDAAPAETTPAAEAPKTAPKKAKAARTATKPAANGKAASKPAAKTGVPKAKKPASTARASGGTAGKTTRTAAKATKAAKADATSAKQ